MVVSLKYADCLDRPKMRGLNESAEMRTPRKANC